MEFTSKWQDISSLEAQVNLCQKWHLVRRIFTEPDVISMLFSMFLCCPEVIALLNTGK